MVLDVKHRGLLVEAVPASEEVIYQFLVDIIDVFTCGNLKAGSQYDGACDSPFHFCREIGSFLSLLCCCPLRFCTDLRLVRTRFNLAAYVCLN